MDVWNPKNDDRVPFFGVDRSARPVIHLRPFLKRPSWRARLYRAWRALFGDFG